MGCVGSDTVNIHTTLYSSKSPIINNLSETNKDRISHLIEKDDILSLAVTMSEAGASPNSEISDARMRWMLIHLCCRWDADNCLEYLLKDYFCSNPRGYIDFINAPTVQGYTPLHLCAMWKSQKCFYVLHHYGGLNFNARDGSMKTPYETACQYSNKSKGKMKDTLEAYRTMNISFSSVENEKLISGVMIAQDISTQMKKKENEKKIQSQTDAIKKVQNVSKTALDQLSQIEKQMIEQKKKLEKEKQKILQVKVQQQLDADAQKAKMLEESRANKEEHERLEYESKMKKQINDQYRKQQQLLEQQLKAKDEELNKVKEDLKRKEEQRIKNQKEEAQRKTEQFMKQKQDEIYKKLQEKEDALNNLKKQEEERARKQKQAADNRLKEIQLAYAKKQEEMNKKLKDKEEQVARMKREQQEKTRKDQQNAQNLTQETIKQAQQQYNKKLKQKEDDLKKYKEQEEYRLAKEKQAAEKKAIQLSREQNKIVTQTINDANKISNQVVNNATKAEQNVNNAKDAVGTAVNQLKAVYKNLKLQLPVELQQQYTAAKKSGAYFDSEFPASNKSIGDPSKANFSNFTTNTVWLRPKQILKSDFKLFDGIDPNDIKQGSLGVCYMLASISALAETPKNIEKIFVFNDTSIGFYILRFYVNGKPKFVTVDDLIPCNKTTKSPLFTKPIGNQVWVLLLEKAWAKLIGDYLSAQSMTPDHMMEDLSAAPSFGSWFEKEGKPNTEHIQKIVRHSQKGHIVVITSGEKKIEGIANNHAYSMLEAYQFNGRYIFKVRNPWGQFEWNGEYGAKSSLWTPELKKLVGYEDKDDGVFHVSENELTTAWVYYSISQITDANLYSFTQFSSKRNENLFYKIKITKPADINIRVTQLFDRMLRDKNYKYSPFIFEVGKIISDNQVKFISEGSQKTYFGAKSVHAFENIVEKLQIGEYFIRIKMLWVNDQVYNTGVLAVYAPEPVNIERLPVDKGTKYMKALFYSQAASLQKSPTGDGFYKISTMKGQFILIGEVTKEGKYKASFKFSQGKMQMAELDLGKVSDIELQSILSNTEPAITTAMRTDPAKGGTTGPVSILIEKSP